MGRIFTLGVIALLVFSLPRGAAATEFDELVKPPEGAHRDQVLLGAWASIGLPFGDILDAEEAFLANNTHTFSDAEITKKLMVVHRYYAFGFFFEYMPIDHLGIRTTLAAQYIIQRTIFGSDYQNWSGNLYRDYSFTLGPALHLTVRKQWDVVFTPHLGYGFGTFQATPVGDELIADSDYPATVGDRERSVQGFQYGASLEFQAYFSGGLVISLGFRWNRVAFAFDRDFALTQTGGEAAGTVYGGSSSPVDTIGLVIGAGYAFAN